MNDAAQNVVHSELPPQARIGHGSRALKRHSAIFPKLLIATLCWVAMFFQQIEACSPDVFRRAPAVSQIKSGERWELLVAGDSSPRPFEEASCLIALPSHRGLESPRTACGKMPQPQSQTTITTPDKHPTVYGFSSGLLVFTSTVPPPQSYAYSTKGNLRTKGTSATLNYNDATRIHAVTWAMVKGSARSYAYDDAGYVVSDGKRTYQWASFGQLRQLDYLAAPDLKDFSGNLVHAASRVTSTFDFDSGGNRARQTKERTAANDTRKIEFTLYLGSYEREVHQTKANGTAPAVLAKTVHRHSLGGGVIYTRTTGGTDPGVKLMAVLADHLGSTDVIVTGKWNTSTAAFANITTERQSFDPWGERRAADTQVNYRATDGDPFRTSAQEHHRGYTGHEQLDDSGLIHMNGRIYDPELGRFLSPDPYVQIPEYSQNFNRYSYVLNNPLNATDPSGFSFLSKFFSKVGSWIKENWRTIVSIVVAVVAWYAAPGILGALGAPASITATGSAATLGGLAAQGAVTGVLSGGFNSAINGGDLGDVLRGAVIQGISGALTGPLHMVGGIGNIVGHGIVGGVTNVAMGGKFGDGFISAAASAATAVSGLTSPDTQIGQSLGLAGRTTVASIMGGTVSVIGGGKFANGAYTSAFQHLVNAEMKDPNGGWSEDPPRAIRLDQQILVFDPAGVVGYGKFKQPITEGTLYWLDIGGAILEMFNIRTGGLVIDGNKPPGSDTQVRDGLYRVTDWQSSRPGKSTFTDFDRKLSFSLDVDPIKWGDRKIWQTLIRIHPDGPIRNGVTTQPGTAGCLGVTNYLDSHVRFYNRASNYFRAHPATMF